MLSKNGYILLALRFVVSYAQSSFSVLPAYVDARYCVQDCLGNGYDSGLDLWDGLHCPDNVWKSGCVCQERLRESASSYLSKCVLFSKSGCVSEDLSTAYIVYDNYCGFTAAATVTTVNSRPAPTPAGIVTVTNYATRSSAPMAPSSSSLASSSSHYVSSEFYIAILSTAIVCASAVVLVCL